MAKSKIINSETQLSTSIIGVFEGECADSNITNENGLDITRPVWEYVFKSEDYKLGIANGYYIGFLGHPEEVDCQDFKDACIVMTEGHIDSEGKVQGKFNLVDTPVGRIVKGFIDAGVTFGISVRGVGDITNNSVEPESFIFRGFDLVAFPAYKESVPKFQEIAASADNESQTKYRILCNTVKENMHALNTKESVEIVKSQFAPQSDVYKALDDIDLTEEPVVEESDDVDLKEEQLEGLMSLYLETKAKLDEAIKENKSLKNNQSILSSTHDRKLKAMQRMFKAQHKDVTDELFNVTIESSKYKIKAEKLKSINSSIKSYNLKYRQEIKASTDGLNSKQQELDDLSAKYNKTINILATKNKELLNRNSVIESAKKDLSEYETVLSGYQNAFANLYAGVLGVSLNEMSITANTDVKTLKKLISNSSSNYSKTSIMASADIDTEAVEVGDRVVTV